MVKVIASHESIERQIKENIKTPFDAFNEYIWNAIDANAKSIQINIKTGSNYIKSLEVVDDGEGINYEDLDKELFKKFNTSPKLTERNLSLPHGNRGFGRFSFIKFAEKVKWDTIFLDKDNKNYKYSVEIEKYSLDDFKPSTKENTKDESSTKVSFVFSTSNNKELVNSKNKKNILNKLIDNICLEFCWVIELFNINISINGKKIDYEYLIEKRSSEIESINNEKFDFKFINWKKVLKDQSSRYYFLNSKGEEVFVDTTTLNKKSDEFYHSLYVKSSYFDHFELLKTSYEKTCKKLKKEVDKYLKKQRKPFIKKFSAYKIKEFEEKNLFPKFNKFEEQVKKPIYHKVVKEVIEFAPTLVSHSNDSQRKILLQLIYSLLDDESSRDTLYNILEILVDEENRDQLKELEKILKKYGLKNVLGTIKLVENRLKTVQRLKEMIYKKDFYFVESDLQRVIEQHFWIFGEEYHLMLCSEEDGFTKLRNIYYDKVLNIPKKEYEAYRVSKKQVDLFISGILSEGRLNKNLIVEIKKPDKNINFGNDFRQIEDYSRIISKEPQLNTPNRDRWDFILLGKDIADKDKKDFEERYIDEFTGLIHTNKKNIRIFVIKWSDLLGEVEFRLKFLKKKLEIKKSKLIPKNQPKTKEEFLKQFDNTAKKKK